MQFLTSFKNRVLSFGKRDGDTKKTISFDQPDTDAANGNDQCLSCSENQGKHLVVATLESRFSDDMIEYTLDMATRMNYGILAVSAANLTPDVTSFFSITQEELFDDFMQAVQKNIASFQERAAGLGLKFAHSISQADVDHAILDITKEFGQIEFIITENKGPVVTRESVVNQNRIGQRLCVYSAE